MSILCVAVVIVLGISPNVLPAGEVAQVKDGEGGHKRLVVRLASVPATRAADALKQLFQAEGQAAQSAARSVVIMPEVHSNSLVLAGPSRAVEEVRQLVMQMDHAAFLVHVDVILAVAPVAEIRPSELAEKKPEGDSDAGQARLLEEPAEMVIIGLASFTTLSDQWAYIQIGDKEPNVRETTARRGIQSHRIGFREEKIAIKIRPRVGPDRKITMSIDVKDSWLAPTENTAHGASKEGESQQARKVEQFQVATTLVVADLQTVVLGAAARQPNSSTERLVLVTPRIQLVDSRPGPRR